MMIYVVVESMRLERFPRWAAWLNNRIRTLDIMGRDSWDRHYARQAAIEAVEAAMQHAWEQSQDAGMDAGMQVMSTLIAEALHPSR